MNWILRYTFLLQYYITSSIPVAFINSSDFVTGVLGLVAIVIIVVIVLVRKGVIHPVEKARRAKRAISQRARKTIYGETPNARRPSAKGNAA